MCQIKTKLGGRRVDNRLSRSSGCIVAWLGESTRCFGACKKPVTIGSAEMLGSWARAEQVLIRRHGLVRVTLWEATLCLVGTNLSVVARVNHRVQTQRRLKSAGHRRTRRGRGNKRVTAEMLWDWDASNGFVQRGSRAGGLDVGSLSLASPSLRSTNRSTSNTRGSVSRANARLRLRDTPVGRARGSVRMAVSGPSNPIGVVGDVIDLATHLRDRSRNAATRGGAIGRSHAISHFRVQVVRVEVGVEVGQGHSCTIPLPVRRAELTSLPKRSVIMVPNGDSAHLPGERWSGPDEPREPRTPWQGSKRS